jgi:hypothetical protein
VFFKLQELQVLGCAGTLPINGTCDSSTGSWIVNENVTFTNVEFQALSDINFEGRCFAQLKTNTFVQGDVTFFSDVTIIVGVSVLTFRKCPTFSDNVTLLVSEDQYNSQSLQTVIQIPAECTEDFELSSINVVSNTNCRTAESSLSTSGLLTVLWSQNKGCDSNSQGLSSGAYVGIGVAVAIVVIVTLGVVVYFVTWYPRHGFRVTTINNSEL